MSPLQDAQALYAELSRFTPPASRTALDEAFVRAGFGVGEAGVEAVVDHPETGYRALYTELDGLMAAKIAAKAALARRGIHV